MSARPGIIITGGAKRIGEAIAHHFAVGGYDIALHYHQSENEARLLQKELRGMGTACELFRHDMDNVNAIPILMDAIHRELPNCTLLVNNASVFERAEFMDTTEALFDRQLDINFKAPFFLTQAFARRFTTGCVINLLDTYINQTDGSHFAYLLSKKALADFTLMAARALGPEIRVNGVCPGIMLPSHDMDKVYMDKLSPTLPLASVSTPLQLAKAIQWLCENDAITGQLLFSDGGQHLL